jgi:hypothetical protein
MKVISLFGSADTGKTRTLLDLVQLLLKNGSLLIPPEPFVFGDCDGNFLVVLATGKRVCITTSGDNAAIQEANLRFVENQKPDIWITASRTRGGSCGVIFTSTILSIDEMIWAGKTYIDSSFPGSIAELEYKRCNNSDANRLEVLVRSL